MAAVKLATTAHLRSLSSRPLKLRSSLLRSACYARQDSGASAVLSDRLGHTGRQLPTVGSCCAARRRPQGSPEGRDALTWSMAVGPPWQGPPSCPELHGGRATRRRTRSLCLRAEAPIGASPVAADAEAASPAVAGSRQEAAKEEASVVPALLDFLNESWTPFHATAECARQLSAAGFRQLAEHDEWDVQPGGRYFFTRNMSSIVAFAVGAKYEAGNGFNVIAAHTDSPCLKLKPVSHAARSGFLSVGVQVYGGGLWYTWFDRDLTVAGRVLLRGPGGGPLRRRLVRVRRPILRIPTLAIHLDRNVVTEGFKPNLETHLAPILATQVKAELNQPAAAGKDGAAAAAAVGSTAMGDGNGAAATAPQPSHHPLLLQILAEELGCEAGDIVDFELNVCDTQPSCVGGGRDEFVLSGRLDNLASSFCALRALADTCRDEGDLADEPGIRVLALFDNEEVGSNSAQGAGSPTLFQAMTRVVRLLTGGSGVEGVVERSLRRSFLVSADMAHALHPNYPERHEEHHAPKLQEGLVVKHNANQRYATDVVSAYLFKEVARLQGIPTQNFVVRNDMGCGSTIGPILASGVGLRTVDVGMPQLSMHSIREMCGVQDIDTGYRHFKAFYSLFSSIDQDVGLDS